jgi:hypothetical protein
MNLPGFLVVGCCSVRLRVMIKSSQCSLLLLLHRPIHSSRELEDHQSRILTMTMSIAVCCFILVAFGTAVIMAWPNEFLDSDVQPGFVKGLAPEIRGLWLGDEKFKIEDGSIAPYCSRAIFYPEGWLTWESMPSTCAVAGAAPKSKSLGKNWTIEFPAYIYRFRQKMCLPAAMCTEDITTDNDPKDTVQYRGWEVLAKACGVHLKDDQLTEDTYTCEQYQVNLIRSPRNGRQLLVVVLSYHFFSGGWSNYVCPSRPSFLAENIADPGDGSTRFVLQLPFDEPGTFDNPCTWDCFNRTLNTNFDCT